MKTTPLVDIEMYPAFEGFPRRGIQFLKNLKKNNTRDWFEKNKDEYESYVKLPMLSLIAGLQLHFQGFAPEFDLNPKRCLFRIYRDVRFSKDKTPYKTHVAAHIVLRGKPKGLEGSGYYLHIEPGEVFVGAGVYMPIADQLKKVRRAIAEKGDEFLAILKDQRFKKTFGELEGNKLKRLPRGFDEDHPMAEWLKFKQFFVGVEWPVSRSYRHSFVGEVAEVCMRATPLVKFLNNALS